MKAYGGFLLFELLLVLCLIAVIWSFGLPMTSKDYQQQQLLLIEQDIQQAIHQAFTEAMSRDENILLRPCISCQDWSKGLILIAERFVHDHPKEHIIYAWQWPKMAYHLYWHGFHSNQWLRFSPELNQSILNGYFMIENEHHDGVKLLLNRMGRIKLENVRGL